MTKLGKDLIESLSEATSHAQGRVSDVRVRHAGVPNVERIANRHIGSSIDDFMARELDEDGTQSHTQ